MVDKLKSNKLGRLLRLALDFDLCHIGFKKYTKKNLNSRFVKYWWFLGALGRIQWIDSSPWNGYIEYIKRKKKHPDLLVRLTSGEDLKKLGNNRELFFFVHPSHLFHGCDHFSPHYSHIFNCCASKSVNILISGWLRISQYLNTCHSALIDFDLLACFFSFVFSSPLSRFLYLFKNLHLQEGEKSQ